MHSFNILELGARCRPLVSFSPVPLYPGKVALGAHWMGGFGGPHGRCGAEKRFFFLPWIEPRPSKSVVCSYTDPSTATPEIVSKKYLPLRTYVPKNELFDVELTCNWAQAEELTDWCFCFIGRLTFRSWRWKSYISRKLRHLFNLYGAGPHNTFTSELKLNNFPSDAFFLLVDLHFGPEHGSHKFLGNFGFCLICTALDPTRHFST
jgi:hypothetical protein